MNFEDQLDVYLRSRFTLIVLVSVEEERAINRIEEVCERTNRRCLSWDLADGFRSLTPVALSKANGLPPAKDPLTALEYIEKSEPVDTVFILKDFHEAWTNPQIKRKLRSLAQRLKTTPKSILITTVSSEIPDELKDEAVFLEQSYPTAADLEEVLKRLTSNSGVRVNLTPLGREKIIQAALGLTAAQAQRVFAKCIVTDGQLDDRDIDLVNEE
ncbi:MAG TPA: AAA family ATPase, partial [Anaerolineaceae bacterium]|nr:AAA family ATPase [Anaerolineaceae bacterium]